MKKYYINNYKYKIEYKKYKISLPARSKVFNDKFENTKY